MGNTWAGLRDWRALKLHFTRFCRQGMEDLVRFPGANCTLGMTDMGAQQKRPKPAKNGSSVFGTVGLRTDVFFCRN
jgi:hypothetical protein